MRSHRKFWPKIEIRKGAAKGDIRHLWVALLYYDASRGYSRVFSRTRFGVLRQAVLECRVHVGDLVAEELAPTIKERLKKYVTK